MKLQLANHKEYILEETTPLLHRPTVPDIDVTFRPDFICVDTECTGLKWATSDYPFGISISWRQDGDIRTAWYDWPVDPFSRMPAYCQPNGLNLFNSWYHDPNIAKVFANAKFDMHMLDKAFGLRPNGIIHDVLLAAWCCNTLEPSFRLNDLAEKYVNIDQKETALLRNSVKTARKIIKGKGYKAGPDYSTVYEDYWLPKFLDSSNNECETYGKKDVLRTLKLWEFYKEGLEQLDNVQAYHRELRVMHKIYEMENRGIRLYLDKCLSEIARLEKTNIQLEEQIKEYNQGQSINLDSPKQLIRLLYGKKQDPTDTLFDGIANCYSGGLLSPNDEYYVVEELTEKGQPSTNAATLLKLKDEHPICDLILQKRGNAKGITQCKNYLKYKLKNGYVSVHDLPKLEQFCLKPTFNQISSHYDKENRTITGRLTASDPNLQNVADASKSGGVYVSDARELFGPREGYNWYCIDYNQLELRIFAERTGGKLKEAFLADRDPHNETREAVPFLAAMEPKKGRKIAKNTNFTLINCGGAGVLYKRYNIPRAEGDIILRQFHNEFIETKARQKEAERYAIENGYIETLFKRKIAVDLTRKSGRYIYAYRASAYDVQGSAADIIKLAMIRTANYLSKQRQKEGIDAHLILSIHDELIFEVRQQDSYKWLLKGLIWIMENIAKDVMEIPLKCEIEKRKLSWSSKHAEKVNL